MKTNWTCFRLLSAAYILLTLCCLLPFNAYANVEVLFSPRDNINYRIIEAVKLSETCIDVAAFDFTSKEMADALVNAKRKGLHVRLLVDTKTLEDEGSQAKRLEEIGFDVKALKGKGKGDMKSAFIIFDGKLVIVGPYHLTEDTDSYNYENAIFFDEPGIVETYQNEFDRLFGSRSILKTVRKKTTDSLLSTVIRPSSQHLQEFEGDTPTLPEKIEKPELPGDLLRTETAEETKVAQPKVEVYVEAPEAKTASRNEETSPDRKVHIEEKQALETQPAPIPEEDNAQMTLPMEHTSVSDRFLDISFDELNKIFGKDSPLSETEKNALWPNYMGKYVKWTGEVTYTKIGFIKGARIGVSHTHGSDTDAEVRFSLKKATKIMKITEGDTITYTAKLLDLPTSYTQQYILIEGVLE